MISRVAESAFWLARYLERIESLVRLQYVNTHFVLDVNLEGVPRWMPLVVVVGEEERYLAGVKKGQEDSEDSVLQFLTWDRTNPSSVASSLNWARENARTIREVISLEMWETLNGLWLWFSSREAERLYRTDPYKFFHHLRDQCVLFNGFALDSMLQAEPFNFMRLGASLERAEQTARILDVKYHALGPTKVDRELPSETAQWQAILRSCSAIEPYFKVAKSDLNGVSVAQFLLFDKHFPRSVQRSLDRAWNFFQLIRPGSKSTMGSNANQSLKALKKELETMDMNTVMDEGLHNTLTRIVDSVATVCDDIVSDFFQYAEN